ncbi:MAG: hypothetical protein ABTQ30_15085 [Rhizobiaceae bacterium]
MGEHEINYPLVMALRLLGLWDEKPGAVRAVERTLRAAADDGGSLTPDAVTRMNDEISRIEEVRRTGPFIAPVDRSLILQPTVVVDL